MKQTYIEQAAHEHMFALTHAPPAGRMTGVTGVLTCYQMALHRCRPRRTTLWRHQFVAAPPAPTAAKKQSELQQICTRDITTTHTHRWARRRLHAFLMSTSCANGTCVLRLCHCPETRTMHTRSQYSPTGSWWIIRRYFCSVGTMPCACIFSTSPPFPCRQCNGFARPDSSCNGITTQCHTTGNRQHCCRTRTL